MAPYGLDPRLAELRAMGMPTVWVRVAEVIGVDAFLAMWFIVDAEPSFQEDHAGALRLWMRRYTSWLRFQRNRYIEALAAGGMGPREIQETIKKDLSEHVSIRHISRIGKRS